MQREHDLTRGKILSKLLQMAAPIMGAQLMQMVYNLADMFWMGRVSSGAVAATGTAGMFLWLSVAFLSIGRMGTEIGVSQSMGGGEEARAEQFARTGLMLAALIGTAYGTVMLVFAGPLIGFFGIQEANVAAMAVDYLRVVALGIPLTFVSAAMGSAFSGSGNSRLPFFLTTAGLLVNMALDPIFIFVLRGGVVGAALSNLVGQILVAVLFFICMKKAPDRPFPAFRFLAPPARDKIAQIFRWAAPIGLQDGLFTFLTMLVSRLVVQFGADAIAVNEVGVQMESLSWLIGGGFASAVTAFVGQNYGAQQWDRIRRGARMSMTAMLIWGLCVSVLLYFGGYFLTGLFLHEPYLMQMGQDYLRVLALCQVFMCLEGVAAGVFRGQGKTLAPSAISITSNLIRVPLAYGMSALWGLHGVYWAITLTCAARGAVLTALHFSHARRLPHTAPL